MDLEINWIAVLLCVIASMAIGFVWYGPLLGKPWMALVGLTEEKAKEGSVKALLTAVVCAAVRATVLATLIFHFNRSNGEEFLADSLLFAVLIWVGIMATNTVMQDGFEQRKFKLTAINLGYDLITVVAFGLIIGLFGV